MIDELEVRIEGMGCDHCVASVREALEALPGVEVERVEIGSAQVRFSDPAAGDRDRVLEAVRKAGYDPGS